MVRVQLGLVSWAAAVGQSARRAAAAIVTVGLGFAGCSNDDEPAGRGGGGGKPAETDPKCGDSGAPTCIVPPAPPASAATPPDTMPPTVVAISELYLGDTDRQGNPSQTAWKQIGFNLDGLISTESGTNHCKLAEGANASVQADGDGGIDNAFGMSLVPLINTVAGGMGAGAAINDSIDLGDFTIMVRLQNFADPMTTPTQTGVKAAVLGGAFFGAGLACGAGADGGSPGDGGPTPTNCLPPKFDGTDTWPLARNTLLNANATTPKVKFDNSFVVDGTWVSGPGAQLELAIAIGAVTLTLPIVSAYITVDLTGTQSSARGTKGTIAGVVNTDQLIAEIRRVAGNVLPTLCVGSTFDAVAQQIRGASDIMSDGTNGDPTKTCNAISIGLGFEATAVIQGEVAPELPPAPDPCADASP